MKRLIILLLSLCSAGAVQAQKLIGITYYDIGRLYDTESSLFYDDEEWAEGGKGGWNKERLNRSVENIASLIKHLNMPIVALHGVENQDIALSIAERTELDYTVAHQDMTSYNGMDYTLLYFADILEVESYRCNYESVVIECMIASHPAIIILSGDEEYSTRVATHYRLHHPERKIILMGSANCTDQGMKNLLTEEQAKGYGTRLVRGEWQMRDRIWADEKTKCERAGIFVHQMLLDIKLSEPRSLIETPSRLWSGRANLPVFAYLWMEDLEN